MDPARRASLSDGSAIAVEKPLKKGDAEFGRVVQVALRNKLRVRVGTRQAELPKRRRHGVGDDHAAATAVHVTEDVIVAAFRTQLDRIERGLERSHQLRVGVAERRRGRRRQAAVTEQKAQGVGVERDIAPLELGRRRQQR